MICVAIAWQNGMVMTFDEHGEQVPEYQGWLSQVYEPLLRNAPEDVKLYMGTWPGDNDNDLIEITPTMFRLLADAEAIPDGRH